jgi:hypothetical protein
MKQYIRDKISQKLETFRLNGHPVSQKISDRFIVEVYQTLSSDGRGLFDMSFSHSLTALQRGHYHLPKELTYLTLLHDEIYKMPKHLSCSVDEELAYIKKLQSDNRLIYFDIVEYRDRKLDQLLVSN